jgi:hypothetical protein
MLRMIDRQQEHRHCPKTQRPERSQIPEEQAVLDRIGLGHPTGSPELRASSALASLTNTSRLMNVPS